MTNRNVHLKYLILIGWVMLSCYILYSYLNNPLAGTDSEISILFYLQTIVLTFPIGYVVGLMIGAISFLLSSFDLDISFFKFPIFRDVLTWFVMVVSGYYQWFILIPKILNLFLRSRK